MRGEDHGHGQLYSWRGGSPPHARGRQSDVPSHNQVRRITPACAGKTSDGYSGGQWRWDHPRMRGEDGMFMNFAFDWSGSPPHARGRLLQHVKPDIHCRITPACAGKTPPTRQTRYPLSDHPRMRGEDFGFFSYRVGQGGSPPHARGRQRGREMSYVPIRITPACAGKTSSSRKCRWASMNHPRMRGEDHGSLRVQQPVVGSPPHARGRRAAQTAARPDQRITPACAGKTAQPSRESDRCSDHPRMRGEDKEAEK